MPNQAAAKVRLEAQRTELLHQLSELGASENGDLRDDVDFGGAFADAAAATAERTEVLGIVDSLKQRLAEVDLALSRVAEGSYGRCMNCGKEIGVARLENRPESVLCIDCKAAAGG